MTLDSLANLHSFPAIGPGRLNILIRAFLLHLDEPPFLS